MANEVESLRQAIVNLTERLKSRDSSSAPSSPFPTQRTKPEEDDKKKTKTGFEGLMASMGKFALGLGSVSTVLKGLQGTREGYQLDYALQHLFYEIADMLRGPIRFLTNEFEGLAQVTHAVNASSTTSHGLPMAATIGSPIAAWDWARILLGSKKKKDDEPEKSEPHLQPILHTAFSDVAGLQQKMQALSTENPAQKRALSLIEQVYNILAAIYNKLPGPGHFDLIPNPGVKKD